MGRAIERGTWGAFSLRQHHLLLAALAAAACVWALAPGSGGAPVGARGQAGCVCRAFAELRDGVCSLLTGNRVTSSQRSLLWLKANTSSSCTLPALLLSVRVPVCLPAGGWLESCFSDCQTQAPYLHLEEKVSKPWYKRSSFHFFGESSE